MSSFQGKKILITGHTGFKGFWLAMILKKLGAHVTGISLKENKNIKSHFRSLNGESLIKTNYIDIRNLDALKSAIEEIKPDYIFHLAAQALVSESFKNPLNTFTTNTIGSINLLERYVQIGYKGVYMSLLTKPFSNKLRPSLI